MGCTRCAANFWFPPSCRARGTLPPKRWGAPLWGGEGWPRTLGAVERPRPAAMHTEGRVEAVVRMAVGRRLGQSDVSPNIRTTGVGMPRQPTEPRKSLGPNSPLRRYGSRTPSARGALLEGQRCATGLRICWCLVPPRTASLLMM